jgi:amylosucrase
VHRPTADWKRYALRGDLNSIEGRVFEGLRRLISLRQRVPVLAGSALEVIDTGNGHVVGYARGMGRERVLILANFSEHAQRVVANQLRLYGLYQASTNLVNGQAVPFDNLELEPYAFLCLRA